MSKAVLHRLLAVLAVVLGVGLASAAAPAVASPAPNHSVVSPAADWWWN